MKRTDAISKLEEYLDINAVNEIGAEQILNFIERVLEMPPPNSKNPNFQGGWNIHTHPMYINEWERE